MKKDILWNRIQQTTIQAKK